LHVDVVRTRPAACQVISQVQAVGAVELAENSFQPLGQLHHLLAAVVKVDQFVNVVVRHTME